jgi:phosphatidylethanolamine-binding protein (PEBP) family uncharacterized protein
MNKKSVLSQAKANIKDFSQNPDAFAEGLAKYKAVPIKTRRKHEPHRYYVAVCNEKRELRGLISARDQITLAIKLQENNLQRYGVVFYT